ncbi:SAM-dependent methyltransferase [Sphaerisporangium rufum]|uniref:SAM-dependent methyltransferase n=1 Tax=Sphaerisporangium rufum TaxID=1381558 RepID=A0A919R151_9ACTN|nr:class I SAM-dependent methyltransferase [Sphaerisporangium rufum]GII76486.1 SAM-dependent methyltransferase [Sphaerisporangium rufum]
MKAFSFLNTDVANYIVEHTTAPDDLLLQLAEETRTVAGDGATMQISREQGTFLTMITQISGARNVVEVGTFTGYSAICLARGLPEDGRLTCFDVSEEWTSVARKYWEKAGVADRIELRIGPAAETLREFPVRPQIDLAFVDADKAGYPGYYQEIMSRLAPGGLILVDNTLRHGSVADYTDGEAATMREFNDLVINDPRVTSTLLPIADGLTLVRKH